MRPSNLIAQLIDDAENAHNIILQHRGRSYRLSDHELPWQAERQFVLMRARDFKAASRVADLEDKIVPTPNPNAKVPESPGKDLLNNPENIL